MTLGRLVTTLYWTAIALFLVGVLLRLISGAFDVGAIHPVGELLNGLAWPVAALSAVIDIAHRQRREDLREGRGRADADASEPLTRRRLRSRA